jgi:hypothetical protein
VTDASSPAPDLAEQLADPIAPLWHAPRRPDTVPASLAEIAQRASAASYEQASMNGRTEP